MIGRTPAQRRNGLFHPFNVIESRRRARMRGGFFVASIRESMMAPPQENGSTRSRRKIWRGIRRPLKYKKAAGLRVCDLIREGFGWREISIRPGMPRLSTLGRWYTDNVEFRELHDRAREAQAVVFRDDVGMLAHALSEPDSRTKLRMDGRKWQVAEHDKVTAGNGGRDSAALDAEFIGRLEAGLPRIIQSGTRSGGGGEKNESDAATDAGSSHRTQGESA